MFYDVALKRKIYITVFWEGRAARFHAKAQLLLGRHKKKDQTSPSIKKTTSVKLLMVYLSLGLKHLVYYFSSVIYCELY